MTESTHSHDACANKDGNATIDYASNKPKHHPIMLKWLIKKTLHLIAPSMDRISISAEVADSLKCLSLTCVECGNSYTISPKGLDSCPNCNQNTLLPSRLSVDQLITESRAFLSPHLGYDPFLSRLSRTTFCGLRFHAIHCSMSLTGSVKDRASLICVFAALHLGKEAITVASCGNAAVSLAAACRYYSLPAHIFVASSVDQKYKSRIKAEGAILHDNFSSYSEAFSESLLLAEHSQSIYSRNTGVNALTRIGKSTLWDSLHRYMLNCSLDIDLIVPFGDGNLLSSLLANYNILESSDRINLHILVVGNGNDISMYEFLKEEHTSHDSIVGPLAVRYPSDNLLAGRIASTFKSTRFWNVPDRYFVSPKISINGLYPCWIFGGLLALGKYLSNRGIVSNPFLPVTAISWN